MENSFGADHNEELENQEDFSSDIENNNVEDLDMLENEDDIMDDFDDAGSMDENDMDAEDAIDLTDGDVQVKIGDQVISISIDDAMEEDNGEYSNEDADELDNAFDDSEDVDDLDLDEEGEEEEDEEDETLEESAQPAAKNDPDKTAHAETMDQSQKNAKGGALKQNGPSGKSESKPVEDTATALKNAAADLDEISGRDIDYKGKHGTESQPAESQDKAMKNAKGHLEGEEHDDTVNSTKNDGKQTSTVLKGVTYESFMSDADRIFNESFDKSFRDAGKAKK